jgi:O-antigen/teichoic acid export membrane protein
MGKLVKNTIFVAGGQTLTKIVSFFSVPIIARLLGTEAFGVYTLVFSFVMLFSGISDMGIENLTIRDISRDKSLINKYLTNTLAIRFIATVLIYLLIIITARLLNYPDEVFQLITILGIIVFANFLINTFNSVIIALEKMAVSSLVLLIQNLINPIVTVVMLYCGFKFSSIFSVIVLANIAVAVIYILVINKYFIRLRFDIDYKYWRYIIVNAMPFAILNIIGFAYLYNGVVILSKLQNMEIIGIYNASYKLVLALLFIPSSIAVAFFPSIARQTVEKIKDNIRNSCSNALRILFLFALPITIGFSIFADKIIINLYGESFSASSTILVILGWTMLFMFISSPLNLTLVNSKYIKKVVWFFTLLTMFSVVINILIIKHYSMQGAAISILITEIIRFAVYLFMINKYLEFKIEAFKTFGKPLLLGLAIGIFMLIMKMISTPFIIATFSSILFYILLLFITKELTSITFIKRIIGVRKN